MYKNTKWLDTVKDAETGEIVQEGTNVTAGKLNNMEDGISDLSVATALMMIAANMAEE